MRKKDDKKQYQIILTYIVLLIDSLLLENPENG